MYTWLKVIWAAIAAVLVLLILLHSPKGDGLGSIGGQAQLFSSTKSAETTLNRLTWTLTVLFLVMTVVMSAGWFPQMTIARPSKPSTSVKPGSPANTNPTTPTLPVPPSLPGK